MSMETDMEMDVGISAYLDKHRYRTTSMIMCLSLLYWPCVNR